MSGAFPLLLEYAFLAPSGITFLLLCVCVCVSFDSVMHFSLLNENVDKVPGLFGPCQGCVH
jgi:hypothetical protein